MRRLAPAWRRRGPRARRLHLRRREAGGRPDAPPPPSPTPTAGSPRRAPAARARAGRLLPAVLRRGAGAHQRGHPGRVRRRGTPPRPSRSASSTWSTNGHLLAVDSDAVREQVARRCPPQLAAYVGATEEQLRLSLLRPVWFTPTIEQSDAGAALVPLRRHRGHRRQAASPRSSHNLSDALKTARGPHRLRAVRHRPARHRGVQPACSAARTTRWKAISVIDLSDKAKDGDYPASERGQGRRPGPSAPTPPARSPPTRSTTSGATSGRPRTSGRRGRPTAAAGHPTRRAPGGPALPAPAGVASWTEKEACRDLTGRTARRDGRRTPGSGSTRPSTSPAHGAHVVLACRNTDAQPRGGRGGSTARTEVAELDLASLESVRRVRRGRRPARRPAGQQRRRDDAAALPRDGRRLRAAVRHQPPRPRRAHRAAAPPAARGAGTAGGRGRLGRPPRGQRLGARGQPRGDLPPATRPTATPSWPTSSSPASSSAAPRPPARRSPPPPPTRASRPPAWSSSRDGLGAIAPIRWTAPIWTKVIFQSALNGARPVMYAATVAEPGSYTGNTWLGEWRGPVGPAKLSRWAQDDALAARLWDKSLDAGRRQPRSLNSSAAIFSISFSRPRIGRTITVNSTSLPSSFHCIMSMPWTVQPVELGLELQDGVALGVPLPPVGQRRAEDDDGRGEVGRGELLALLGRVHRRRAEDHVVGEQVGQAGRVPGRGDLVPGGDGCGHVHQKPSFLSCRGSRCQSLAIFTCRSR